MSRTAVHPDLPCIAQLCQTLRGMIATTKEPGVAVALRHALDHVYMAGTYLGDDLLSPEVEAEFGSTTAAR